MRAVEFIVHDREFQAERGWLAVNAVAAADAGCHFMFVRAAGDDGQKFFDVGNENVRALDHLHSERGVHDIAARQSEMKPAAGGVVDFFGDGFRESDDVVVAEFFNFLRAFNETFRVAKPMFRSGVDFRKILLGHDAFLHQRFTGEQLDLQPNPELVFVGPDCPHLRAGITLNHGGNLGKGGGFV